MDHNERVIAECIDYLAAHYREQPPLDFLAGRAGYEATYFQKLFTEKTGVSPKKFIQCLSHRHARDFLLKGHNMIEAADAAGLSGAGRFHDLFVSVEAATPGEVKRKGAGLTIRYGWHPSVLGEILVAATDRGLCWTGFKLDESRAPAETRMRSLWPEAAFVRDDEAIQEPAERMMGIWGDCRSPHPILAHRSDHPLSGEREETPKASWVRGKAAPLNLHLYGTNFQLQVWRALLEIPCGSVTSYQSIAQKLGSPKASRAVGGAVGANPVSLLIPCHRVIQGSGIVENYGWGAPRKKMILGLESQNIPHGI